MMEQLQQQSQKSKHAKVNLPNGHKEIEAGALKNMNGGLFYKKKSQLMDENHENSGNEDESIIQVIG